MVSLCSNMNVVNVSVMAVTGQSPTRVHSLAYVHTQLSTALSVLGSVLLRSFLDPNRVVMKCNQA